MSQATYGIIWPSRRNVLLMIYTYFYSFYIYFREDKNRDICCIEKLNQYSLPGYIYLSFVWSQNQYLTLLFISSFVFISHLTNFLSYSVFTYVPCFFCLTLTLRKNLLGSKRKAINK